MRRRTARALTTSVVILATALNAREIGFIEEFSLAPDRAVPLARLIPGTEDHYYYHCLHLQHQGKLKEADSLLARWIAQRKQTTPQAWEIKYRQALLTYDTDPKATLAFIIDRQDLTFAHQRETLENRKALPTVLDQDAINRKRFWEESLRRHGGINGVEDGALWWLAQTRLPEEQRRRLLSRLRRPDVPRLPKLVVDDLRWRGSKGFGSMQIHRDMLLDQLDECLELEAGLLDQTPFVHTYLTKLHPKATEDWKAAPDARQAYLDRMWAFVSRLSPSHNSLKAHVLYHRLDHDRRQGVYDRKRLMAYLKLPRNVSYANRDFIRRLESRSHLANLGEEFSVSTLLPPVRDDEEVVRDALAHFFVEDSSYAPFAEFVSDLYLKQLFAETKLTNGIGDAEQWLAMLNPSQVKQLKERVDLDFAPDNRVYVAPGEPVSLQLDVKNVEKLIVKVFELNTSSYYRQHDKEIGTDIDLDGLVANDEAVHTYDDPPIRRVRRRLDFPGIKDRGVYVVELIGNGKSSRALVRKGMVRHLVRTTTAGQVFTVLDEANRQVKTASIWLAGQQYAADENGEIVVPFTNKPGEQKIVVSDGRFASLATFRHESETYELSAGFFVAREALISGNKVTLLVRPSLTLNGTPVTLSVLEEPRLVIETQDVGGTPSRIEFGDIELREDSEIAREFRVPTRLSMLRPSLAAKIKVLSLNEKKDLVDGTTVTVNTIDHSQQIEQLLFSRLPDGYVLDLLGKNGEAKPGRPVELTIRHEDFKQEAIVSLQTDDGGRIRLGELAGIATVSAKSPTGSVGRWDLLPDRHSPVTSVHGLRGEALRVPYMGAERKPSREQCSLLEVRSQALSARAEGDGATPVRDRFDSLRLRAGFLEISGLEPGDYVLRLREQEQAISIRVDEGRIEHGFVLSATRHVEQRNPRPVQIAAVDVRDKKLIVRLENATPATRVHVVTSRYAPPPDLDPFSAIAGPVGPPPGLVDLSRPRSHFLSGRDIGDEYRYVIDRKYAKRYAGNMLRRPGLLLNPWAVRDTQTEKQDAAKGDAWAATVATPEPASALAATLAEPLEAEGDFANVDFLARPGVLIANLHPGDDGTVTVDLADLPGGHQVHVVAIDPLNTACRRLVLPETRPPRRDLRLLEALPPDSHAVEKRQVSIVKQDGSFVQERASTSRFEVYDTLSDVYELYVTLSSDATLTEFRFVLDWPSMSREDKEKKVGKYACHELSLFLHRKDPAFFESVVLPYLRNKRDKTFLDHWLLGNDLSEYARPWAFAQLNIVERILLARRLEGEREATARHVQDLFDLLPVDPAAEHSLFESALSRGDLSTAMAFGEVGYGMGGDAGGGALEQEALVHDSDATHLVGGGAKRERAKASPPEPRAPMPAKARRKLAARGVSEGKPVEAFFAQDRARGTVRQLYRALDKTKEWAESNYYHVPMQKQNAELITVNGFWLDFATHTGGPFVSPKLVEPTGSFAEMMLALAVLDLPFGTGEHKQERTGDRLTITAAGPMAVFHREIRPVDTPDGETPILVAQHFFRNDDRYRHEGNEQIEKHVTDEFVTHVLYGCHLAVTNPTARSCKLSLLFQVPQGAMPVGTRHTEGWPVDVGAYQTETAEVFFYFPEPGRFSHFPIHVAVDETLVARARPMAFNVVDTPTSIDTTSWAYVSQNGSPDEVVSYLRGNNLERIDLAKVAFRMRERPFFERTIALLEKRHTYNDTLWSYGVHHNHLASLREYLRHNDAFVNRCGAAIDCTLLRIDPVERKAYEHLEYGPLVNARVHQLGKVRQILNNRFHEQYHRFLRVLSCRPELDDNDLLAAVSYLLLQERIDEALAFHARIDPSRLASRLQYDYVTAYLSFFREDVKTARGIAEGYRSYPVPRWRDAFVTILNQLDEMDGGAAVVTDDRDREQVQAELAATEPVIELKVEANKVRITYANAGSCQVNYYPMDVELLFSRNPFLEQDAGRFTVIRPNETQTVTLPEGETSVESNLPQRFRNSNVMVEVTAGSVHKSSAYFANSMTVQVMENYGQISVRQEGSQEPLSRAYVKAYARMKDGSVRFYRDGYTDLRGRFDYTSLSTDELDRAERFALLVMSDEHGAVVKQAAPPKR